MSRAGSLTGNESEGTDGVHASISFNDVEARVVHKGFTADQLRRAIDEYTPLNVIDVDDIRTPSLCCKEIRS